MQTRLTTAAADHVQHEVPRLAAVGLDQRGADQRGQAAREDPGELVDRPDPGVAHPGVEQLGPERRQRRVDRHVDDAEPDRDRQPDQQRLTGVDQGEGRERQHGGEHRADDVDGFSAHPVGELAVDRHQRDAQRGRDHDAGERDAAGQVEVVDDVRDREDAVGVEGQALDPPRAHAQHELLGLLLEHGHERDLDLVLPLAHRGEGGRLEHLQPDVEADPDQHDAEQERHPPAPRVEGGVGQQAERGEHQRGAEQAGGHSGLGPAAVEAALALAGRTRRPSARRRRTRRRRRCPARPAAAPAGSAPRRRSGRRWAATR